MSGSSRFPFTVMTSTDMSDRLPFTVRVHACDHPTYRWCDEMFGVHNWTLVYDEDNEHVTFMFARNADAILFRLKCD